jgi:hypothetical protein
MSWKSMLMATAVAAAEPDLVDEDVEVIEITDVEARMIRMMIRDQLAAFRAGDAERAWRFASEGIRSTFVEPERLLSLIRQKYAPLTNLKQLVFGEWSITPDGVGIALEVLDQQYRRHRITYLVVRESDGWKVNGAVSADPEAVAEAA